MAIAMPIGEMFISLRNEVIDNDSWMVIGLPFRIIFIIKIIAGSTSTKTVLRRNVLNSSYAGIIRIRSMGMISACIIRHPLVNNDLKVGKKVDIKKGLSSESPFLDLL
jgi:hypothetical protein